MKTLEYLLNPDLRCLFMPGVAVGIAVAVMCAVLSVLAVLKRMSFVGQGVSHAALGGVGVAALLGLAGGGFGHFAAVLAFCLLAGFVIAWLGERRTISPDTAIGIVLVAAMAAGVILVNHAASLAARRGGPIPPSWESILFGSISEVTWAGAVVAWGVGAGVLGLLWWNQRPMLFWAFDQGAAPAFGVPAPAMRMLLMGLLTLAIVASIRLVGVVLVTALLVLPGATALLLSRRLWPVVGLSVACGVVGVLGGMVVAFELSWPPGPSIVAVLAVLFAGARAAAGRSA